MWASPLTTGTNRAAIKPIAAFRPLPWQVAPWRDRSPVILLTGSAGGGKSRLAAEKLHGYALKYPGATALLVRKARVSITNSTAELLRRVVIGPDPRVVHMPSKSRFEYANGSLLLYTGMDDEGQRERVRSIGAEGGVDIAWMEEATEFSEDDSQAISARLRGRAAPWRQLILSCNPDAPTHWIYRRLIVGGGATIYTSGATDNHYNPADYLTRLRSLTGTEGARLARGEWVQATGLVYDGVWSDGPMDGNVTTDAEYDPDAGSIVWAVDDGYAGAIDSATGTYTAESHPRVILFVQERADGRLCVVAESYACQALSEQHLAVALVLPYAAPEQAVVDKSAAELKGRLHERGIYTRNGASSVEESIKVLRAMLAPDANGWRRILVHPRCAHLRSEMASYRRDPLGAVVKQFDHGPDALRYVAWTRRLEA